MRYYNVSIAEMREAFAKTSASGKKWTEGVMGFEVVFDLELVPRVVLRVYTGINKDTGNSRGKGKDAIRVCAFSDTGGLVKSQRVLRVVGWHENLKKAILLVAAQARARLATPKHTFKECV